MRGGSKIAIIQESGLSAESSFGLCIFVVVVVDSRRCTTVARGFRVSAVQHVGVRLPLTLRLLLGRQDDMKGIRRE